MQDKCPQNCLQNEEVTACFNVYVETEICKPNYLQVHTTWLKHNKVDWRIKTAAHYFKRFLKPPAENESILKGNNSFSEMLKITCSFHA